MDGAQGHHRHQHQGGQGRTHQLHRQHRCTAVLAQAHRQQRKHRDLRQFQRVEQHNPRQRRRRTRTGQRGQPPQAQYREHRQLQGRAIALERGTQRLRQPRPAVHRQHRQQQPRQRQQHAHPAFGQCETRADMPGQQRQYGRPQQPPGQLRQPGHRTTAGTQAHQAAYAQGSKYRPRNRPIAGERLAILGQLQERDRERHDETTQRGQRQRQGRCTSLHFGCHPRGYAQQQQHCMQAAADLHEITDFHDHIAQPPGQRPQVSHGRDLLIARSAVPPRGGEAGHGDQQSAHEGGVGNGGCCALMAARHTNDQGGGSRQLQANTGPAGQTTILGQAQPYQARPFQREHRCRGLGRQGQRHRQGGESDCENGVAACQHIHALVVDQRACQHRIQRSHTQCTECQRHAIALQQRGLQ